MDKKSSSVKKSIPTLHKLCLKCERPLASMLMGMLSEAWYCPNPKCEHYGVLTVGVGYVKKLKNAKE